VALYLAALLALLAGTLWLVEQRNQSKEVAV